jgi:hypothetical protein
MDASLEPLTPEQQRKQTTTQALVALIETKWSAAVSARSAVTLQMNKAHNALKGKPLSGEYLLADLPITYNISASMHRGIVALLADTFAASAENLFVVNTTTVPTLTDEDTLMISQAVREASELENEMTGAPMTEADAMQLEQDMTADLREDLLTKAQDAAQVLGEEVKDSFEENGWASAITQGLYDFVAYPAMVVKAPAPVYKKKKVWDQGRMKIIHEVINGVERIAPYNFYPAPNAEDVQSADYIFELRTISANELVQLADDPLYDSKEIMRVFDEHPTGFALTGGSAANKLIMTTQTFTQNEGVGFYDVRCFYGKVMGVHLGELGIEGTDPMRQYEAEVFVIGSCVIRAVLTSESGRPFHTLAYDPVPGSLWGESPVTRLFDVQSALNNAFASMIADLQLSGLHVELTTSRLHSDDQIAGMSLAPRVVRKVNPDPSGSGRRAYDIFTVQPNSAAFRETMADLEEKAYKLVGFTRMTLGETQGSGTIGRTAGGVASMLNQASKLRLQLLRSIEGKIIEPVVQSFIDTRLMTNPPPEIRGDVNVRARGLTGMVEREGQVESLQWQLQTLAAFAEKVDPVTGRPIIPSTVPLALVKQMFRAKGLKTEGIFPEDTGGAEQMGAPEMGMPASMQEPAGSVQLDNRSPDAAAAIEQSNNPMGMNNA